VDAVLSWVGGWLGGERGCLENHCGGVSAKITSFSFFFFFKKKMKMVLFLQKHPYNGSG